VTEARVHASDGISISRLGKTFRRDGRETIALHDVSLEIRRGEFVSIVGPSGCGKSTLMRIVAGLMAPDAGHASVLGRRVEAPVTDLGIVFQSPVLLDWRDVLSNVLFQVEMRGLDRDSHRARAIELLRQVGLSEFADRYPHELSGGMRQRTAIARALLHDPPLLLMDEPFGALDEMTREYMQGELLRICGETGTTVVFVTHSIPEAVYLSQRVVVMSPRPGRITRVVDVPIAGARTEDTRNSEAFFRSITAVREGLRGHGAPGAGTDDR
jgi:NitT/TauT family transport system ATP-binding protein